MLAGIINAGKESRQQQKKRMRQFMLTWLLPSSSTFKASSRTLAKEGKDKTKGRTYTWLPSHLADGRKAVSPRSFLAAIRAASDHGSPPEWIYALRPAGLREGVRSASRIRVDEIYEDYPWVRALMEPLTSAITVPCPLSEFIQLWEEKKVLSYMEEILQQAQKLHPAGRIADTKAWLTILSHSAFSNGCGTDASKCRTPIA